MNKQKQRTGRANHHFNGCKININKNEYKKHKKNGNNYFKIPRSGV